ncbi:MAG TPA: cyclodeaminase/cyclohydrolase family protein, partial [Gaiellaceae bacterium]
MASSRPFLDLTLAEWLDELAAARAAPGGGSALAVAAANAAAVLTMAARVSGAGGLVAQAEALRARTAPLAQVDADT